MRNKRVLACAPSNVAVDNIIELLVRNHKNYPVTRLGHPARISDIIKPYSLDYKTFNSEENKICDDIIEEINKISQEIKKCNSKYEKRRIIIYI